MRTKQDHFSRTALAAAVAASFPGIAFAQSAAKVDFAIGVVTATGGDGRTRSLEKGSDIAVGDLVKTGTGRVQLRYADGAQMALQPDTEFKIEEFRFAEGGQGKDGVVLNLFKGGLRTITGVIGRSNRNAYSLKTPMATVGIRGTEFTAEFRDVLRAFCVQGLIFVNNGGGNLLLAGGQGAFVNAFTSAPQRDDSKPSLPTISRQEMDVLLKLAGVDPQNPTQDFNPAVTLQTALAQLAKDDPTIDVRLKGTQTGMGAATLTAGMPFALAGQTGVFDNDGKLTRFSDSAHGEATLGTATATSLGNDGILAWGKWTDGVTGGTHAAFSNKTLTAQTPLHYIAGLPVSSMPVTGLATYNMLGSSASCAGAGCTTAKVDSSSLAVDFAAMSVNLAMSVTVDGTWAGTYLRNGSAGVLNGNGTFFLGGGFANSCGASFCNSFSGAGFLSGSGALRAGLAWDGTVGFGNTAVSGVTAYEKGSTVASPVPPPPPSPMLTGTMTGAWSAALFQTAPYYLLNSPSVNPAEMVVFDAAGRLTQFADTYEGTVTATLGSATATSSGNSDGIIAWGAWANGTTSGTHPTFSGQDLSTQGPMHYVVGLPVSNMPTTGIATYNMTGSTAACSGSGCTSAVVNSASLSVNFPGPSPTVGLNMSLTVNGTGGGVYTVASGSNSALPLTGALNPNGTFSMGGSGTVYNSSGSNMCNGFQGAGFLAGNGAVRAGMTWNAKVNQDNTSVSGATVFTKQ